MSRNTLPIAYFIVRGAARERIEAIFTAREVAASAWLDFAADIEGAGRSWSSGSMLGSRLAGFEFAGKPPAGWKPRRGAVYCVPDKRTAEGKSIAARMDALPEKPAHDALQCACMDLNGIDDMIAVPGASGLSLHVASAAIYSDTGDCVVGVYHLEGKEPIAPQDSERIPTSHYWRLREDHEAAESVAKETPTP